LICAIVPIAISLNAIASLEQFRISGARTGIKAAIHGQELRR
jgi:hypothetical protein